MIKYYLLAVLKIAKAFSFQLLKSMILYIPLISFALYKGISIPLYMYFSLGWFCFAVYTLVEALIGGLSFYAKCLKDDAEKAAKAS
jgi:hypothetical protein